MELLPAIDLRNGCVVRLEKGDYAKQTTYEVSPLATAEKYVSAGAKWIHIVDLDAALTGELTNTQIIRDVCKFAAANDMKVENGGGIRDTRRVKMLLDMGVRRVVVGSTAMKNFPWFAELMNDASIPNECIALGLDARDGKVAAQGWTQQLDITAVELARRVSGSGLGAIVYTDIARDGMLQGVNIESTADVIAATNVPVIASGGVAGLDDIRKCLAIGCGGVILGKALYEGKINLADAVKLVKEK
ncbi:MAG TPA: 1-(5-phosphoribosyl)-5-[(5-phosphoribosylamino)methylideneamino]imidazole-4-carboxamide isomerase [Phycisphaerae bacterium]|nr:1-(5-phosphoribosyl)-5-[(5-phosphoribosylamino)methylideneamino]imidazole-4-carboxamide isomerase [Phycisphaerae bacterium]HPS52596.1 1-(5-phosphoribosyl)-5-[(5-phosphoribosylamino)methylideneamino]imidazole-4-carboxamide isomerase [Phycisphaerae bacterium]